MNKKKFITMTAAVALIGAMGVGATLAYFTDTEETTNVVTMGHVDIELYETDGEKATQKGLTFENVVPGEKLDKDPYVVVADGSEDCYIRMSLAFEKKEGGITDDDLAALEDNLKAQIEKSEDWFYEDGYYYYVNKMSEGDSATLFETVTIPTSWANNTAGSKFNIVVSAEAIQADYLDGVLEYTDLTGTTTDGVETTIRKITGWDLDTNDDEVNDIAIEKYTKQTTGTTEESVQ